MATRKKAAAQPAPATKTEAGELLVEYKSLQRNIDADQAAMNEAIALVMEKRAERRGPLEARQKEIFLALRSWWGVAADEITGGKAKSFTYAGCIIGTRMTTPSLKIPAGLTADGAVYKIRNLGLGYSDGAIRVKESLDKPAILKLIAERADSEPVRALMALGFASVQRDEFFIDTMPSKTPATAEIAVDDAVTSS